MEIELSKKNRIRFFIEGNDLIIKKRSWFSEKEIKRIEHSSIKKISYNNPNTNANPIKWILHILFFFIANSWAGGTWKEYLNITYEVDGDIGVFHLDVRLSRKDYFVIRKHLISKV